jgi:hypothetical protein
MQELSDGISRLEIFFRYVGASNIRNAILQIAATTVIFKCRWNLTTGEPTR